MSTKEGLLDKPAQIGGTIFGIGIKHSTVIARAQREYEYQQAPEREAARMEKVAAFRAALVVGAAQPIENLFLVDGVPHRRCDCDPLKPECRLKRTRTLLTTEFSRCLVAAPEVVVLAPPPALRGS